MKPKASGAANRRRQKDQAKAALLAKAAELKIDLVDPVADSDEDQAAQQAEAAFVERVRELGLPPMDPIESIVWANKLTAIVTFSAAVDPPSHRLAARRRAVLDGIRALGLTNSRAVDKARLLRVEERLGIAEGSKSDGLQDTDDEPALRA